MQFSIMVTRMVNYVDYDDQDDQDDQVQKFCVISKSKINPKQLLQFSSLSDVYCSTVKSSNGQQWKVTRENKRANKDQDVVLMTNYNQGPINYHNETFTINKS